MWKFSSNEKKRKKRKQGSFSRNFGSTGKISWLFLTYWSKNNSRWGCMQRLVYKGFGKIWTFYNKQPTFLFARRFLVAFGFLVYQSKLCTFILLGRWGWCTVCTLPELSFFRLWMKCVCHEVNYITHNGKNLVKHVGAFRHTEWWETSCPKYVDSLLWPT